MNNTKTILIASLSILLTACGGGGSGSSAPISISNGSMINISAMHNEKTIVSNNPTSGTKINDINTVTFKGRSIKLMPSLAEKEMYDNSMVLLRQTDKGKDLVVRYIDSNQYLSKFGHIFSYNSGYNGGDDEIIGFSQGITTPVNNMPSTGTVSYQGVYTSLIIVDNEPYKDGIPYGSVKATADFLNKKLDVTLSSNRRREELNIVNSIVGNTFSSSDNKMKGAFYGNKAQDLGGVYNEGNGTTAFGATCLPNCQ